MKKTSIILFLIGFMGIISAQNVGINATGAAPHSSAGLDINFTDKGFLVPRVALTALNSASPISSPTVSLLVYNTATAGSSPNNVIPGYYYWDGSVWVAATGGHGGRDWSLLGNAGTLATTNFIGTTDAQDLVFKTNAAESMRILSSADVGIGTASPTSRLHVVSKASNASLFECSDIDVDMFIELKGTKSGRRGSTTNLFDIGINAASSYAELQAYNSSGTYLNTILNKNGGNVGIGTTVPGCKMGILGGLAVGTTYAGYNAGVDNVIIEGMLGIGLGALPSYYRLYIASAANDIGIGSAFRVNASDHATNGGYLVINRNSGAGSYASIQTGDNSSYIGTSLALQQYGGKVGIGTTGPAEQLEITQNFRMPATTGSAAGVIMSGATRFIHNYGSDDIFIGLGAGNFTTTGLRNVAVGSGVLAVNTTGACNIGSGWLTLMSNTTGGSNTAIGNCSLFVNSTGNYNSCLGGQSLNNNFTGNYNTGIGCGADVSATNLNNSMALGAQSIVNASNKIRLGDVTTTVVEGPVVYTVSDGRFKYDISDTDVKGLDFIKRLRPVVYNFNTQQLQEFLTKNFPDSTKQKYLVGKDFTTSSAIRQSGFIAQEVEQAMKESGYNFNGVHVPENENDNYSLAYGQFVVPIIKAMQEQQQTIEEQQLVINELKEKNKNLQTTVSNIELENKTIKAENKIIQSENNTIKVNYDKRLKALEELMGVRAQK